MRPIPRQSRIDSERRLCRASNRGSLVLPKRLYRHFESEAGVTSPFEGRWGTRQYVHPDLVCHRGSLALVATAYPFGAEIYEVPEVFVLEPSGTWKPHLTVPPLRRETRSHHYSDPDLLSGAEDLILYYRKCERDRHLERGGGPGRDRIYALAEGSQEPRLVLLGPHTSLLSPSVVPWAGGVLLFCVDASGPTNRMRRFSSPDPWSFAEIEGAEFGGHKVWHLDVALVQGRLLGAFLVVTEAGEGKRHFTRLILGESRDGGRTWDEVCPLDFDHHWVKRVYRSSLCECKAGLLIALGYETMAGTWGVEIRHLEADGAGYHIGEAVDSRSKAWAL